MRVLDQDSFILYSRAAKKSKANLHCNKKRKHCGIWRESNVNHSLVPITKSHLTPLLSQNKILITTDVKKRNKL